MLINCKISCQCLLSSPSLYNICNSREIIINNHFIPRLHKYILNLSFKNQGYCLIFVTIVLLSSEKQWNNPMKYSVLRTETVLAFPPRELQVSASVCCGLQVECLQPRLFGGQSPRSQVNSWAIHSTTSPPFLKFILRNQWSW